MNPRMANLAGYRVGSEDWGTPQREGFLTALILCLGFLVSPANAEEPGGPSGEGPATHRAAVFRIEGKDIPESGLDFLSELVRQEVAKSDSLIVLDRTFSADPDQMHVFALETGDTAAALLVHAGHLGVDKVVTGTIARLGDLYIIELRMIDVASGQVERAEIAEFVGELRDIRIPVRTVAQRLVGIGGFETLKDSYLHISSTPTGAKVFIDGLLEGRTPQKVRVAPRGYEIKVVMPGYTIWEQDVQLKSGETLSLNAALIPTQSVQEVVQDGREPLVTFAVPYIVAFAEGALYLMDVESGRPYLGAILVGGPLGYYATSRRLAQVDISIGRAWMIISSGLWGAAWGILGAGSAAFDEARPYVALSMAVSALGIYGSAQVTAERNISRKRVSLINIGGFMGSAVGLGIPYLLDAGETRSYTTGLLAGGVIGALGAMHLTRGLDFTGDEISGGPAQSLLSISGRDTSWGLPMPRSSFLGSGIYTTLMEARFH